MHTLSLTADLLRTLLLSPVGWLAPAAGATLALSWARAAPGAESLYGIQLGYSAVVIGLCAAVTASAGATRLATLGPALSPGRAAGVVGAVALVHTWLGTLCTLLVRAVCDGWVALEPASAFWLGLGLAATLIGLRAGALALVATRVTHALGASVALVLALGWFLPRAVPALAVLAPGSQFSGAAAERFTLTCVTADIAGTVALALLAILLARRAPAAP